MRLVKAVALFSLVMAGSVEATHAEEAKPAKGDVSSGKSYAQSMCASCHSIGKGASVSPNVKAPPFDVVAKSKLVTSREIDIWLQTAHPDMPDLVVPAAKRSDVIAFIESLADKK